VRIEHYEVGDQGVVARRIVQLHERFARKNRNEPHDHRFILCHVNTTGGFTAAFMDALAVTVRHRLARQEEGINRSFCVLKHDYTPSKGRGVVFLVVTDDHCQRILSSGRRFEFARLARQS
jgi:hypothetical protein